MPPTKEEQKKTSHDSARECAASEAKIVDLERLLSEERASLEDARTSLKEKDAALRRSALRVADWESFVKRLDSELGLSKGSPLDWFGKEALEPAAMVDRVKARVKDLATSDLSLKSAHTALQKQVGDLQIQVAQTGEALTRANSAFDVVFEAARGYGYDGGKDPVGLCAFLGRRMSAASAAVDPVRIETKSGTRIEIHVHAP